MKKILSPKILIVFSLILMAGLSAGFFITQETRDFRIAKNLDIFFSLFRELNLFYVDDVNPDKIIKTGIDNMLKSLDPYTCLLYTSDAADDLLCVDLGGRSIMKKKKKKQHCSLPTISPSNFILTPCST